MKKISAPMYDSFPSWL